MASPRPTSTTPSDPSPRASPAPPSSLALSPLPLHAPATRATAATTDKAAASRHLPRPWLWGVVRSRMRGY